MPLRIGLVADIHYGADLPWVLGARAPELLAAALEQLVADGAEVIVDLGDRLNDESPDADASRLATLAGIFRATGLPTEHLRGNHDLLPPSAHEALLGGSLANRSRDAAGWHLAFLDTFDGTTAGRLAPETLSWLDADLAATSLPSVVFAHQPLDGRPLVGNALFEVEFADHAHPIGHDEARRVIEASGKVRAVCNGHAHWNHLTHVADVPYLSIGSLVARTSTGEASATHALLELDGGAAHVRVYGSERFDRRF